MNKRYNVLPAIVVLLAILVGSAFPRYPGALLFSKAGAAGGSSNSDVVFFYDINANFPSFNTNISFFTATYAAKVVAVSGRVDQQNTGSGTFRLVKASSGTSLATGTNLTTASFATNGAADTTQTLTVSSPDALLAIGDSIGIVIAGTNNSGAGSITVTL